jgi:MYXO-CTERM domain-containing protein
MQADPVIAVVSTLLFGVVALLALAAMLRRRAGA